MKKKIFFAYGSSYQENVDAISSGSKKFNNDSNDYSVQTWEMLNVVGTKIDSTILKEIEECEIFACDMTYLNNNVIFELGYAIGKGKRLLIFLNDQVTDASQNYRAFKLLSTYGYDTYSSSKQIYEGLSKSITDNLVLNEKTTNTDIPIKEDFDIFFINSQTESEAAIKLGHYFDNYPEGRVLPNNYNLSEYMTWEYYTRNIYRSKYIILHMNGNEKVNSTIYNAEISIIAGLAAGRDKLILLIAPNTVKVPLDYTDITIQYSNAQTCLTIIKTWIESHVSIAVEYEIDADSLIKYISENALYNKLLRQVIRKYPRYDDNNSYIAILVGRLQLLKIKTLSELDSKLQKYQSYILDFMHKYIEIRDIEGFLNNNSVLWYLCYVLFYKESSRNDLLSIQNKYNLGQQIVIKILIAGNLTFDDMPKFDKTFDLLEKWSSKNNEYSMNLYYYYDEVFGLYVTVNSTTR